MKKYLENYIKKDIRLNIKQKIAILASIIVFAGVFGFVYEFIFYYMNSGFKEFYYRGGNFLPWINIYAYGAILIILLTYKYRKSPLKVFLIGTIACGLLELFAGCLMYDVLDEVRCWDYNQEILSFGNIGGYVCIRSVLIFGLSGLLLMYAVLPLFIYMSQNLNQKTYMIIAIIICSIFLIDEIYNLIFTKLLNLPRASSIYKKIGFKYLYFN